MLTLCGLYVAQGIPFGFVTITFASWLARPENGLTIEQLGPILAVATLPWSFKFVWGPLMDRFTIRSLGRRRPWIIFSQSMAILVLGSMIFPDDLPGMVWTSTPDAGGVLKNVFELIPGPLAAMILVANIFVSMQDVAVDALAVDLLQDEERGIANGLMYASSYLGTAVGGAGLGFVVARFGIHAGMLGQAVLLFLIMLLPIFIRERPGISHSVSGTSGDRITDESLGSQETAVTAGIIDFGESPYVPPQSAETPEGRGGAELPEAAGQQSSVIADLWKAFSLRATFLGAVVALSVRVGMGVLTAVLVDFLMKGGGWTQQEYTNVTGGWAVLLGLTGSAIGGYVADRTGPKRIIFAVSALLGVLWIGVGLVPGSLVSRPIVATMLLGQEFLFAMLLVSLFSLFMTISWPKVAATQFTTYMALMNLSTTIGSYIAGSLSRSLSVQQILVVAGILQMVLVIPVLFIDVGQTRRLLGR